MVIVDGRAYQVHCDGRVGVAGLDARAPFAVVTRLRPTLDRTIEAVGDLRGLEARCDAVRDSGNIFYAFRLDGRFSRVRARAVSPPRPGARLIDAAKAQSEFYFGDVEGNAGRALVALASRAPSAFLVITSTFFPTTANTAGISSTARRAACGYEWKRSRSSISGCPKPAAS